MVKVTSHPPGTFCWIELGTSDAASAQAFYTQLFGWTVNTFPMGEMADYHIFQKDGADSAAMYQYAGELEGMHPFWMSYIAVADADAATQKAKSLGGGVHKEPFDVMENGRMAVLVDPQGAVFSLWQATGHPGVGVRDEPNALCWNELQVREAGVAKTFYASLFDWRLKETPEYTEFHVGQHAVGGMMAAQGPPEVPSQWLPYFAVDDCDASLARAQSLGAQVFAPSFDVPNVGRMAVVADPQGAPFAIIKLTF